MEEKKTAIEEEAKVVAEEAPAIEETATAEPATEDAEKKDKIPGTKPELAEFIENLVKQYNSFILDENYKSANELNDLTEQAVNKYTAIVKKEAYDNLAAIKDPVMIMIEACKQYSFETIKVRDIKDKETGLMKRVSEPAERPIDLISLNKYVEGGIGADSKWPYMIQKLNALMTARACDRLDIKNVKEVMDNYTMDAIAREIDMGKNPVSNTNLLKTLNSILAAMVGMGYNAKTTDVNHMIDTYVARGRKALSVKFATHKLLTNECERILNRVITDDKYEAEVKKRKA